MNPSKKSRKPGPGKKRTFSKKKSAPRLFEKPAVPRPDLPDSELRVYRDSAVKQNEQKPDSGSAISRLTKSLKGEAVPQNADSAEGKERIYRINQFLARAGYGSRRETESVVLAGRVTVNGRKITSLDVRIFPADTVTVDGKSVKASTAFRYIVMNKPAGYTVSRKGFGQEKTIYSLLPEDMQTLKYAGRLDRESRGLLILSDDGDFIQAVTHPSKRMTKRYIVTVNTLPAERDLQKRFYKGVEEGGELLRAIRASVISRSPAVVEVVLGEGKNRHIRRMFRGLGIKVTDLYRVSVGFYSLDENPVKEGSFREVDPSVFLSDKPVSKPLPSEEASVLKDFNPWKKKV